MTWFVDLTGIAETSPDDVRAALVLDGETIVSKANGRSFGHGVLEMPSLSGLRSRLGEAPASRIAAEEVVTNVQALLMNPGNTDAVFQVASQFNLLEMVGPSVTPERGVGIYENDPTQGPACAIACGAGTTYRNYLVRLNGRTGQSADNQIDCLADLGARLGNDGGRLWQMQNGYALATAGGLDEIGARIGTATEAWRDELRGCLRIGLHKRTQVTLGASAHRVTQAFCSAMPVAYSGHEKAAWEPFARLVLEATYEATFATAALNLVETGNPHVYLTSVGGGAFGNATEWIHDAIGRALHLFAEVPLRVHIVSYGRSNPAIQRLLADRR